MHPPTVLSTIHLLPLLAATAALALPLNINLGAYSPALVVGDGAISFEGAEGAEGGAEGAGVAQIVNALQGAAVSGGAASAVNAAAVNTGAGPGVVQAAAAAVPVVEAPTGILDDPTAALPTPGSTKILDPRP